MGSWRERRRGFRRKRSPTSPPIKYNIHDPLPEFWHDGIPIWEKKFCTLIGGLPWQKIVDAKNIMVCHSNVLRWDDTGAKEAFDKAKTVYWEKINNIDYEYSPPHPDIYLDEIDWNCYIDPELVKDLDREYFAPPEEEEMMFTRNKRSKISPNVTQEVKGDDQRDYQNPWESDNMQKSATLESHRAQGWDRFDDNSCHLDNQNNPWECRNSYGNEKLLKNVWKCPGPESWGQSQVTSCSSGRPAYKNFWDQSFQGLASLEEKGWGNSGLDSWGSKHQGSKYHVNNWDSRHSHRKVIYGDQKGQQWKGKSDMQGWKNLENKGRYPKDSELRRNYGGWRSKNESYKRNEESHLHPSEVCSRFQQAEYSGVQCWGRGTKKRVGFPGE